jgi:uroporphyrinogen III methyltransferase/synthase
MSWSQPNGKVWLVGAGPGDPALITARGLALLRVADAVVYDRLSPSALLEECPRYAERFDVGKIPGRQTVTQEEINALLVRLAREGKRVVRLKGGDPYVFGRGSEEALALDAAGISWEEVPGVSAAIAAAAYAGVPLTHREIASSVAVVTGHDGLSQSLVAHADTLVILMAVEQLDRVVERLCALGRAPIEPAALIHAASTPDQHTLRAPLGEIVEQARTIGLRPPATLIVGPTVVLAERLNWFERRPLFGRRILIARTRPQPSRLAEQLRELGAEVIELPTIQVRSVDCSPVDAALRQLAAGRFGWVVFGSALVVEHVWVRLAALGLDSRALRAKVAAYGSGTVEALERRGIRPDCACPGYLEREVARHLLTAGLDGSNVLLPCLDVPEMLCTTLANHDCRPVAIPVAEIDRESSRQADADRLRRLLNAKEIDAIVFPASRGVELITALLQGDPSPLNGVPIVCMGPSTAETARRNGFRVDVVAEQATFDSLVRAVVGTGTARERSDSRTSFPNREGSVTPRRQGEPARAHETTDSGSHASTGSLVLRYALRPEEIESLSLQRVRVVLGENEPLEPERRIVHRIVYAAGDPTLAPWVRIHPDAVAAGVTALRRGRPIVVDVRMVEAGLNRRMIAQFGCPVRCGIDLPEVAAEARRLGLPRAVVAMRQLHAEIGDGIVVIGNAPTALLSLLDLVDAGQVRPALIVGVPVGFVAAAESKAELAARAVPFMTIEGTRGGSALAAAAINALLQLAFDSEKDQSP